MEESTEWPEYDVPADALADGVERTESRSAGEIPDAPPKDTTETPPIPATDGKSTEGITKPTDDDSGDTVPRYRLNETQEARRKAEAEREAFRQEAAELRRQMDDLQRQPRREAAPPPAQPTEPLTDEDRKAQGVREGLMKLFPELRQLPEMVKRLEASGKWDEAAEATGAWRETEKTFYERHTDTQLNRLHTLAAEVVVGQGKTSDDLPEMMRGALDNAFGRWVFADPQRRARYDALDGKLVDEFWPLFKASNIDPLRRSDSAAVLATVAARPKLPKGGSVTGAAPPAASPKPKAAATTEEDEDAFYADTWRAAQESIAGKG